MRTRRIYWILSVVLLWIICSLLFNYFYKIEKESKIEEVINYQKVHARLASRNFEQLFNKWNNVLYYLSRDSNVIQMNPSGKEDLVKLMEFLKNEIKGITRTDASGRIIFTLPEQSNALGRDISHQKHMIKLLTDQQPVVSDVFRAVQGYQAIVIHYPIFKNKKYSGSIALLLDFEKLSKEILSEIKIGRSGFAWMLSCDSTELFCNEHPHMGKKIDVSHSNLSNIIDSMLSGKSGISAYSLENNKKDNRNFAYYLPIKINNTFWSMAITYSEEEITASLLNFRNRLLLILSIVFIGGIFLSYYGIKAWIIIKESELRKIAEKNLKESEDKYRIVIETTDTGYAVTDNDGKILDANKKFAEMTGHDSIAKIIGKTVGKWTSIKDYESFHLLIRKCLREGSVHNLELEFKHFNGKIIPVEINASKVNSKNQDQIIMLCRDIAERKRAKEEIMKERTLLRTLIDNLPTGVFIKDTNYRKTIANSLHLKSVIGHLRRAGLNSTIDIIGKTDFEVFSPDEARLFLIDDTKVIEQGHAIINQVERGWGPNDERIWVLVSKVPIKADDGSIIGMVGVTTDITDQKRIEEQLTIAKEKAEQSDRLKTAFLNNISHEIRTPLNAIIGFSGLLKEHELTPEKRNHYAEIISQSSDQLLLIITDIINIATIEAGQLKVNSSKVNINSVLSILYEQYKGTAALKKLALSYTTDLPDDDAVIETDSTKFLEILSNLINNAIKFCDRGLVSYGYMFENNILMFFVEDTGIGIKPDYHQAIFDRFFQIESPMFYKHSGTGLGLSISKTYVELLGGKIWLTSEPGVGSTFYFTLPYKK